MGALHDGHRELIRLGRELAKDEGSLIVSIFVNPTQFGPEEDFESYPDTFSDDCQLCEDEGVDILFHPSNSDMYQETASILITEKNLTQYLCGPSRPGHFEGVCIVVTKLFNITQPTMAVFGKKDYQQLAVIRQLVRNLNFPIEIIGAETIREEDGLAISSRNRFLNEEERSQAPAIRKALLAMSENNAKESTLRLKLGKSIIASESPLSRIDYLEIVDRQTMQKIKIIDRPALAAAAVFLGKTRIIDNIEINPTH